jgi:hypothetical protein
VAINAGNLDGGARLVVEIAVAVRVLPEMAVNAVHTLFEMYVLEMDGRTRWPRVVFQINVVLVFERDRLAQSRAVERLNGLARTIN